MRERFQGALQVLMHGRYQGALRVTVHKGFQGALQVAMHERFSNTLKVAMHERDREQVVRDDHVQCVHLTENNMQCRLHTQGEIPNFSIPIPPPHLFSSRVHPLRHSIHA